MKLMNLKNLNDHHETTEMTDTLEMTDLVRDILVMILENDTQEMILENDTQEMILETDIPEMTDKTGTLEMKDQGKDTEMTKDLMPQKNYQVNLKEDKKNFSLVVLTNSTRQSKKLFEILGGKTCSSCGFRDERALGFAHAYDGEAFDQIRRGGFASSWGKYISDPELAREELRVLCLNCNEIREPPRKTQPDKPKKKSRYFPR